MQNVLVVDDVQDNITLLTFELEDDGFNVIAAHSGEECLQIAQSDEKPDIILLDIRMPGLSGTDTLRQLKSDETTEDIPVIMVSANDADELIVECIDMGAHDFVSKPIVYEVLAARMRSALRLSAALNELAALNQELNKLATTDPLTNAYNRRHFFSMAEIEDGKAKRHSRALSVMMMDIDHFKSINDTHGHAVGDTALQAFVKCCQDTCRGSDILGRLGGEEFALCCPDTDINGAEILAERIRILCKELEIFTQTTSFSMTISIGATQLNANETFEEALHRADVLLYHAKNTGRDKSIISMTEPEKD